MREHFPMRGECPGHLMDLNFSFDHNFLIGRFQGTLRKDLIEDSFLLEPTECSIQSRQQVLFKAVSCFMLSVPPRICISGLFLSFFNKESSIKNA